MTDEQIKAEGTTENTEGDIDVGNEPKASSLIDSALATAERLESANKKTEELIKRQEEVLARQLLSGRADVSQQEAPKTTEQTAQELGHNLVKKYYG